MMEEQQTTPVALKEMEIQELVSRMRGELLRPGDVGYEQACRVYNGMIEKRPALIAHCVDVADVIAAVNFAREHELTLAVRGGGHSGPGLGTCDDGLVIEPSALHGACLETHHDHRLAMAFGLIGLRVAGVEIDDAGVVSKSWPGYWGMLGGLR